MKALTTLSGNFGPFDSVETLADRYRCISSSGSTDLPFSVVGLGEIVDADTVPLPVTPPAPESVPQKVTRRQAKQALLLGGLLANVQPAIDAIADPMQRQLMDIEWNDSQDFERTRPSLIGLATALGLSSEALDDLFRQAAKL